MHDPPAVAQAESSPNLLQTTNNRQLLFLCRPTEVALRARIPVSRQQGSDIRNQYQTAGLEHFGKRGSPANPGVRWANPYVT